MQTPLKLRNDSHGLCRSGIAPIGKSSSYAGHNSVLQSLIGFSLQGSRQSNPRARKHIFAVFLYECLRNLMFHIRHPTVLSPRDGSESALRRFCTSCLELPAYFLELMTLGGNLSPRDKFSLALLVVAGSKKTQTTVNASNMANVFLLKFLDSFGNRPV